MAFSHLIPEVQEGFSELDTDYPVGFSIVIVGYLLIMMLEKIIFHHAHAHDNHPVNSKSHKSKSEKSKLLVEEDDVDLETQKKNTIITPLALTIALSIHSLFEGIVFGIQSNHANTLNVMIALISHKPIETLFTGIVMVKEKVSLVIFITFTIIIAISTPAGIGIGVGIQQNEETPELLFAVFTALAAGSFLYISTTEIIAEEFQQSRSARVRWTKFFFLLLGVAIILVSKIWLQDTHTHGEDDHDHDHDHDH